jgi:hypothetical protein
MTDFAKCGNLCLEWQKSIFDAVVTLNVFQGLCEKMLKQVQHDEGRWPLSRE